MVHPQIIVQTLLDLTRTLRETDLLEEQLQAVADASLDVLPADHGSLRILNSDASELLCGARSGDGLANRPAAFQRGEGVIGWVVEHGRPAKIDDTALDKRFVEKEGQSFGIGSMLAVPVWDDGQVIGVLAVAARPVRVFNDDDLVLAELIANCAVPHIARARKLRLLSTLMPVVSE